MHSMDALKQHMRITYETEEVPFNENESLCSVSKYINTGCILLGLSQ